MGSGVSGNSEVTNKREKERGGAGEPRWANAEARRLDHRGGGRVGAWRTKDGEVTRFW